MIFFNDHTTTINAETSDLNNIYNKLYLGNSPIPIKVSHSGKICEGAFKVLTMFDFNPTNDFDTKATFGGLETGIRNLKHLIFGAASHYTGSGQEGNHFCGERLAEEDELGMHWVNDSSGGHEMTAMIQALNFGHTVKMMGSGYTNNIATPVWRTDADGNKWSAPLISHYCNFQTLRADCSTVALDMDFEVLGTAAWKKHEVTAPMIGVNSYYNNIAATGGAYSEMTTAEINRYIAQLSPYMATRDNNKMFKLDVIEKTSSAIGIGASTSFIDINDPKIGNFVDIFGTSAQYGIFSKKIYLMSGIESNQYYFQDEGNSNLSTQEYCVPLLFGRLSASNTEGTFGYNKWTGVQFEYNAGSTGAIIALAKAVIYNNNKNNIDKEELAVYTLNNGQSYIFSNAIDLRNIATSGAVKGKVEANIGDIVVLAMSNVYIISDEQATDYIWAVSSGKSDGDKPVDPDPVDPNPSLTDSE